MLDCDAANLPILLTMADRPKGLSSAERLAIWRDEMGSLDPELEARIAQDDHEETTQWVALAEHLNTSTVEAHLRRARDPGVVAMLSSSPNAPLSAMEALPMSAHSDRGLQKYLARREIPLDSSLAEALFSSRTSSILLGQLVTDLGIGPASAEM